MEGPVHGSALTAEEYMADTLAVVCAPGRPFTQGQTCLLYTSPGAARIPAKAGGHGLPHGADAVSYTHLDVYKRQISYMRIKKSPLSVLCARRAAGAHAASAGTQRDGRPPGVPPGGGSPPLIYFLSAPLSNGCPCRRECLPTLKLTIVLRLISH